MYAENSVSRGLDLVEFTAVKEPILDRAMWIARVSVKELKRVRASVVRMGSIKPDSLRLGFAGFEPDATLGQVCTLRLMCPQRTWIEKASGDRPAKMPGVRVRNLARLYEDTSGKAAWRLAGWMENTKLTALLTCLKEANGGELTDVDLILQRTPKPSETRPIWSLFITTPRAFFER